MPRPRSLMSRNNKQVQRLGKKLLLPSLDEQPQDENPAPSIDREGNFASEVLRKKRKRARGRASTILAGRRAQDLSNLNVAVATLLGD